MRSILLLLVALFTMISCEREGDELPFDDYVGTWKWISTTNTNTGSYDTPESTGKEISITFNSDKTYSVIDGLATTSSGTFYITTKTDIYGNNDKTVIVFSDYAEKVVSSITDTELIVTDNNGEGDVEVYERE